MSHRHACTTPAHVGSPVFLAGLYVVCMGVVAWGGASGRPQSRLKRVLDCYENHVFRSEDRAVGIDLYQWAKPETNNLVPSQVDSGAFDTTAAHQRTVSGEVRYDRLLRSGDSLNDYVRTVAVAVGVRHVHADSTMHGYDPPDFTVGGIPFSTAQAVEERDTVEITTGLSGRYSSLALCYTPREWRAKPHLGLGVDLLAAAHHVREENFDPLMPVTDDNHTFHSDKYKKRTERLQVNATVSPGVGVGRQVDVSHVNPAFELERELKRCGALAFSLADETVAAVAALMARNDTYRLRDVDEVRLFKAELDSILLTDAAVVKEHLGCLSPFVVTHLLAQKTEPVYRGGRIMVLARQRLSAAGWLRKIEFPYAPSLFTRFYDQGVDLEHQSMFGFEGCWGTLLTRQWSAWITMEKRLLSSKRQIEFYRDGTIDAGRLVEFDWSLGTAVWAGTSFRVSTGLDHLLCHVVLPKEWPYRFHLTFEGFIEDYVTLGAALSRHYADPGMDRSYVRWALPAEPLKQARNVRLYVQYLF